ncbi:MAG: hypothetical protein DWQ04_10710 [Chloroflexi bacterium]|nr:MAG: hypothetical protein DWQ04_10710 [Chloroflexota bacterium]
MKRIIFLIIGMLFLAACSAESVLDDGLSNAVSLGWDEGVAAVFAEANVNSVKCDVHPWMNVNQAQATCRLDVGKEDALKLGADGPVTLYLGGLLTVSDDKFTFDTDKPFTGEGKGQMRIAAPFGEGDETQILQNVNELPIVSLTAQIDGLRVPVEITGVASMAGAKEFNVPSSGENLISAFEVSNCEGQMIPNSSLASIIMIGELKDGQQVMGGGILDTNVTTEMGGNPDGFQCDISARGVVFEVEVNLITWGGDVATAKITNSETGSPIIYGVVINHEEQ